MQRKPSKKTRGINAAEKKFMYWVKEQPCIVCGNYPCVVDHAMGSAWRNNKVLVGMWYLLPLCQCCDSIKTQGSRRGFRDKFGLMSEMWVKLIQDYHSEIPEDVILSIKSSRT